MTAAMKYITEYNTAWPRRFEEVSRALRAVLPEKCRLHHVGSTSVPGMPAKDIVDLIVECQPGTMVEIILALGRLGYEHQGDRGIPGREAFRSRGDSKAAGFPPHHLYACEQSAHELRKQLAFRDYLRLHPERMTWLAQQKRLADAAAQTRDGYIARKDRAYATITAQAMQLRLLQERDCCREGHAVSSGGDEAIGTLVCPQETRRELLAFRDSLSAFLGDRLVGLYLYGSLASGCYNGKTSDVDVLAVLSAPIDADARAKLLELHQQATIPVDATYITADELNVNIFPTPLQCVIRPVKLFRVPNGLIDFLVVRQDTHDNGIRLCGPQASRLVQPVPWETLRQCVLQLLPVALERFKNPILMLCRIVCTLDTHRPCSKAQAGRWALANLASRWHDMISQAMCDYEQGLKTSDLPAEQALAFEAHCREQADLFRKGD